MGNPEVLLRDEPSEGFAPIIVLLAEQNVDLCEKVATHAANAVGSSFTIRCRR